MYGSVHIGIIYSIIFRNTNLSFSISVIEYTGIGNIYKSASRFDTYKCSLFFAKLGSRMFYLFINTNEFS